MNSKPAQVVIIDLKEWSIGSKLLPPRLSETKNNVETSRGKVENLQKVSFELMLKLQNNVEANRGKETTCRSSLYVNYGTEIVRVAQIFFNFWSHFPQYFAS